MASIITLFSAVTVACICFGNANNEFVTVECTPKNKGVFGQRSLLDCVIKTSDEVEDPHIVYVSWKKDGDEDNLLVFSKGKVSARRGYAFAEPSWDNKNMNVSLLISNTAIEHQGQYTCMVHTDSGNNHQKTTLDVTAKYRKPTITSDQEGRQHTLTCDADGGHPKGDLRWYVGVDTEWPKGAEFQATQREDGRFHLSSTLTLMPGSTFSKYTCVVLNASGVKEEEVTFDIVTNPEEHKDRQDLPDNPSRWVAPLVVIGSLIIGLLLLLLFLRRRSQRARRHSAAPLIGAHVDGPPCEAAEAMCDVEKGDRD